MRTRAFHLLLVLALVLAGGWMPVPTATADDGAAGMGAPEIVLGYPHETQLARAVARATASLRGDLDATAIWETERGISSIPRRLIGSPPPRAAQPLPLRFAQRTGGAPSAPLQPRAGARLPAP